MNKYKVGDKIVLTVSDVNEKAYYSYYVFNNNDLILWEPSTDKYAEPLSTYTEPLEAKIRRQAAEITRLLAENKELKEQMKIDLPTLISEEDRRRMDINKARAEGAEMAWELARKITCQPINGGFNRSEFEKIFGYGYISDIFERYTYPEAAAKVAEWEKVKEIKVGDVVSRGGIYGVVKSVSDDWLSVISDSGISFQWLKRKCTKTGRHIDIDGFLKQIGGE